MQPEVGQALVAPGRVVVAGRAPAAPLDEEDQEDQCEERRGELSRRHPVAQGDPGADDPGREGRHAEEGDGAVVGQGLHQGERGSGRDRRPRQGQGHPIEAAEGAAAEGAADLQGADRLLDEGGPAQQVAVGVEHEAQHDDRAAQGADLREPVASGRPTGRLADQALNRTGELQEVRIGVGHDVGRHRQRQDQGPFEDPPAGEAAHGHQPGGAGADHRDRQTDPQDQERRVHDVAGQDGGRQMPPGALPGGQEVHEDAGDRKNEERGDPERRPGEEAAPQPAGRGRPHRPNRTFRPLGGLAPVGEGQNFAQSRLPAARRPPRQSAICRQRRADCKPNVGHGPVFSTNRFLMSF
jgi:hypothetical protein